MRYLALDVGVKRVGLAVGSTEAKIASPVAVVKRATIRSDAAAIQAVVDRYEAERLVVGLPREANGALGPQAISVMRYVERLGPVLGLPVEYSDERYSTVEALARQREAGVAEREGRQTVDANAAAVILQNFLDSLPTIPNGNEGGK